MITQCLVGFWMGEFLGDFRQNCWKMESRNPTKRQIKLEGDDRLGGKGEWRIWSHKEKRHWCFANMKKWVGPLEVKEHFKFKILSWLLFVSPSVIYFLSTPWLDLSSKWNTLNAYLPRRIQWNLAIGFFVCFPFLEPLPQHMEVPRLGV